MDNDIAQVNNTLEASGGNLDNSNDLKLPESNENIENNSESQMDEEPQMNSINFHSLLHSKPLLSYNISWDPLIALLGQLNMSMGSIQKDRQTQNETVNALQSKIEDLEHYAEITRKEKDEINDQMQDLKQRCQQLEDKFASKPDGNANENSESVDPGTSNDAANVDRKENADGVPNSSRTNKEENSGLKPTNDQLPIDSKTTSNMYATKEELDELKRTLRKQLSRSLSQALGIDMPTEGRNKVDSALNGSETENEDISVANDDSKTSSENEVGGTEQGESATKDCDDDPLSFFGNQPRIIGAPFASDDKINNRLHTIDETVEGLVHRFDQHDGEYQDLLKRFSDLEFSLRESMEGHQNREAPLETSRNMNNNANDNGPSTELLAKQLQSFQLMLVAQDNSIKENNKIVGRHSKEIQDILSQVEDLALQQATMNLPNNSGFRSTENSDLRERENPETTPTEASSANGQDQTATSGGSNGPANIDLSLFFTKLSDLRKSTLNSIDEVQQKLNNYTASSDAHQKNIERLGLAWKFLEQRRLDELEDILSRQKKILGENQKFQDKAKLQIVDWENMLASTEAKLYDPDMQKCQLETKDEMITILRQYHRLTLGMAAMVPLPPAVNVALDNALHDVNKLGLAFNEGVFPLPLQLEYTDNKPAGASDMSSAPVQSEHKSNQELEVEYDRRIRYLGEEIAATLNVSSSTEKKNDVLLKLMERVREKWIELWSLWHQNFSTLQCTGSQGLSNLNQLISNNSLQQSVGISDGDDHTDLQPHERNSMKINDLNMHVSNVLRRLDNMDREINRISTANSNAAAKQAKAKSSLLDSDEFKSDIQNELIRLNDVCCSLESSIEDIRADTKRNGGSMQHDERQKQFLASNSMLDTFLMGKVGDNGELSMNENERIALKQQEYNDFLKEVASAVTKNVINHPNLKKLQNLHAGALGGNAAASAIAGINAHTNYRTLLESFSQKVEERLDDAQDAAAEELAKAKKELFDTLKHRIDIAIKDLRYELMLIPIDETTAVGTKPVMCVACSRPVPISTEVRDVEHHNYMPIPNGVLVDVDDDILDHRDDDREYVYRGGFKMPANDRKQYTALPNLVHNVRSKLSVNKASEKEKKPRRPPRQGTSARVDAVVREAMELDRPHRSRKDDVPQE